MEVAVFRGVRDRNMAVDVEQDEGRVWMLSSMRVEAGGGPGSLGMRTGWWPPMKRNWSQSGSPWRGVGAAEGVNQKAIDTM